MKLQVNKIRHKFQKFSPLITANQQLIHEHTNFLFAINLVHDTEILLEKQLKCEEKLSFGVIETLLINTNIILISNHLRTH